MNPASDRWKLLRSEGFAFLGLFVVALLIRLPHLLNAPGFEFNELQVTLELAHGERFPLYNQRPHIGALANYINAAAFHLLGYHYWVPRVVILVMGALTVPLLYRLGRRVTDRPTAVLASLFLAGSLYHVFEISHVSWSNSMTPFFTTLCLLAFLAALQESKGWMLVLSGFLFGLALQTHPSVITLIPALAVIFLLQGKEQAAAWLRRPALYLTVAAAMAGYANMIYYNISSHLGSVTEGMKYPVYALEVHPTVARYFRNTADAWTLLLRLLSGAAEDRDTAASFWLDPMFPVCAAGLAAGAWRFVRERRYELALLLLFPMLIIPVLNHGYDFCKFGRYLGFLLPIGCLMMAGAVVHLYRAARARFPSARAAVACGLLLLPAAYFAVHLVELNRTYEVLLQQDETMPVFRKVSAKVLAGYDRAHTTVLIDPYGWKSLGLSLFLASDGWNTGDLMGGSIERSRAVRFRQGRLQEILRETDEQPGNRTAALISPAILQPFLEEATGSSGNTCLMLGPVKGGFFEVLSKTIYYAFEVQGGSERTDSDPPTVLSALLQAQPLLPDDPEEWREFRKPDLEDALAANPGIPVHEISAFLKQSCVQVSVRTPEKECRICSENEEDTGDDNDFGHRGRRRFAQK